MEGVGLSSSFPPRRAPLNEDVFTPPVPSPALSLDPDIQELSEQIHRLLLQVRVEGTGLENEEGVRNRAVDI